MSAGSGPGGQGPGRATERAGTGVGVPHKAVSGFYGKANGVGHRAPSGPRKSATARATGRIQLDQMTCSIRDCELAAKVPSPL
jgi:hypothetical protein